MHAFSSENMLIGVVPIGLLSDKREFEHSSMGSDV
jgi:hypothetical protein